MNDTKNILLAWIATVGSMFEAVTARTLLSVTSAVVLPIIFFAIGKSVDVMLQIYFRRKDK